MSACSRTAKSVRQRQQGGAGVEVKIADNGEVLVRGAMVLKEYCKRPDATAESIDPAPVGFHTGDAGVFDADGQLKIIDRARTSGHLSTAKMFAELHREQAQVFSPSGGGLLRSPA